MHEKAFRRLTGVTRVVVLDNLPQTYLDGWEERWADTRIHGTTKPQVAAMFAEGVRRQG